MNPIAKQCPPLAGPQPPPAERSGAPEPPPHALPIGSGSGQSPRSGVAGFQALLRRSNSSARFDSGLGSAARPASLDGYEDYLAAAVAATEFCARAARQLIGGDGRLDSAQIESWLKKLDEPIRPDTPAARLSDHHRQHLRRTLSALCTDPALRAEIDGTCEHRPLIGAAVAMVRATLGLPPSAPAGKREARIALVMALLANLRQRDVDSCFATATAIQVQQEAPARLARELRELLENNALSMRAGTAEFQIPLNKRCSKREAQMPLRVRADGVCFGVANGTPGRSYALFASPCLSRAFDVLGIAQQDRPQAVARALAAIARRKGADVADAFETSALELIRQVARSVPGRRKAEADLEAALDAFAGGYDVRLLRAWEYTLATHSNSTRHAVLMQELAAAALFGQPIPARPDLPSPDAAVAAAKADLRRHSKLSEAEVECVGQTLNRAIVQTMKQRFLYQFDADLERGKPPADGAARRGGFVLYDRGASRSGAPKRIDSGEEFRFATQAIIQDAVPLAEQYLSQYGLSKSAARRALERLVHALAKSVKAPTFPAQSVVRFNIQQLNGAVDDPLNTPWLQARGGSPDDINAHFGSAAFHQEIVER